MKFLGMGGFEFVIILIVVLLIFGPKNLPKLGKAFGKTVSNLREGINEGKKKDDDSEGDEAEAEVADPEPASAPAKPAEIEGVVEEVVEPEAESATFDAEAAVDEVFEQKKVRRVVKKKVAAEEEE